MGIADLVPGVSGGTVALITGIYGELLESIKSIDGNALKTLRRDGIAAAWRAINGTWLTTLVAGMVTSAVLLAGLIDYLLDAHGLPLWSFFSGVISASAILLLRRYRPTFWHHWFLLICGVHAALALSTLPPIALQGGYTSLFFAGSMAFCAMILPGLSGTLILVALGLYPTIIAAIAHFQLDILAAFGAGGILGLLLFSRLLSWLMRMHQTALMATMCGFLIGSLKLVWPWRYRPEFADEPSLPVGMINLLPKQYAELAQIDPATTECLVFALLGLLLVAGFDYVNRRSEG